MINGLITEADDAANTAEEEDDATKCDQLNKYKLYLKRCLKQEKVRERKEDITAELVVKLRDRNGSDVPEIMHISAAEYMQWIKRDKILFRDQPALSQELTGIPAIRRYLFALPTRRNLSDVASHIETFIPTFLEKLKRIATPSERDAGFLTIADEFDALRTAEMGSILSQTKACFQRFSKDSFHKMRLDTKAFRSQVDNKIEKQIFTFKSPTLNKILKSKGFVAIGASKAKGLEQGCHWNQEFSEILAPGFIKWGTHWELLTRPMKDALCQSMEYNYNSLMMQIERSQQANLMVIERTKKNFMKYRLKLSLVMNDLMKEVEATIKRKLSWALMETGFENNLVASIADKHYETIFKATPALKNGSPTTGKGKRYVEPKLKHQKKVMGNLFMDPKHHFVDKVHKQFYDEIVATVDSVLDKHFGKADHMLSDFSTTLRDLAPINYETTLAGDDIRADLDLRLPEFERISELLRNLLPEPLEKEKDEAAILAQSLAGGTSGSLDVLYEEASKRKRKMEAGSRRVRIKKEP